MKDLENLNRSTEHDFLAVGERLIAFRSIARQITSDMEALTELISGEHGRQASEALQRMLDHCRELDSRIEQGSLSLGEVRDLSRRIHRAFTGLRNTVSVFRTLCTLTRIETARLGGAGADMGHLTAEVGPLSESIQSSGERVIETSSLLDHEVQSALLRSADLRRTQLKELPALISGVIASLKSFEERQRWAVEASARQAEQHAKVSAAIDGLVESIQFHDITRQQVEHVVEALRHLVAGRKGDRRKPDSPPRETSLILLLQVTHLSEAARVFADSVERMLHDLESIAERAGSTPEASKALLGISGDGQESFFLKMEVQFSAILDMLGLCSVAQAAMETTGDSLKETVGHMQESVAEIQGTEIRIQRISTNATIRATHIGAPGVALNKIAEVMHRLALESSTNTDNASMTLEEMASASGRVSSGQAGSDAQSTTEHVIGNMRRAVGQLHSSSESSFARVNDIVALSARLAADLGALRSGFSAGQMFAGVVERARLELDRVGAEVEPLPSESHGTNTSVALEQCAATYTMQRQRDIHESVVGGSIAVAPPKPASAPAKSGELGDNVELF
jgi:hypothetical protein